MARPKKFRRICSMPKLNEFCPTNEYKDTITMSVDEFEVIRLLDYENMTQEQCALQMNVSRATVTSIYETARKKIADTLVNGKRLIINGGDVVCCENAPHCCGHCGNNECDTCHLQSCSVKK